MSFRGRWILVACLAATLAMTGCTAPPTPPEPTEAAPSPEPTSTPLLADRLPLTGTFVSQGATTVGTVTIEQVDDETFAITLSGFSTTGSDDLRLNLSSGPLVQDADGFYFIDGFNYEVPADVQAGVAEQSFEYPSDPRFLPADIQSVQIYDYANLTALGSAALD